jgi:hypothetical protein
MHEYVCGGRENNGFIVLLLYAVYDKFEAKVNFTTADCC